MRLLAARADPDAPSPRDQSELIVALGSHLDRFVAALFDIEQETETLNRATLALDPIHSCKRLFVQRQAVRKYPDPAGFDGPALRAALEARFAETPHRAFLCPARQPLGKIRRTPPPWTWQCAMPPGPR